MTNPEPITTQDAEAWRQARINSLLKQLNANAMQQAATAMERKGIEEELRSLGWKPKERGGQKRDCRRTLS